MSDSREGSLEAPTRHPVNWKAPVFYDEKAALDEMERVFDICHGCRRCVSLCNAFPTLFDLVDESKTMEIDGVDRKDFVKVVDQCYLCDLCYLTKCPYVPPHEWNVDFPHLMLRGKAIKHKNGETKFRDKLLTSTDTVGNLAGIPVVSQTVNALNKNKSVRKVMDKVLGIHPNAIVPDYHSDTLRKREARRVSSVVISQAGELTQGKVALFATCYCNRNEPELGEDLIVLLEHNGIPVKLVHQEVCCGMPKLELGDLDKVEEMMKFNIPQLVKMVNEGWDILAPVPSCVLMFKEELPLLFPDNEDVKKVAEAFYDPFEYFMLRNKENKLKTEFKNKLGKIAYHVPCHQRVQKIGLKTKDMLMLVPDTTIEVIERCSGHDGTYAVKSEYHDIAAKICRPVSTKVKKFEPDHYVSDCPMAGDQIQQGLNDGSKAESPFSLLRYAYGL
ncbi:MAG: heterodisulfide reductase-related iron-sulfur binding cluster [Gammaproteobacteria bacterium]|jgi:glycerol-3-phosphate dehydrogenase subunit C